MNPIDENDENDENDAVDDVNKDAETSEHGGDEQEDASVRLPSRGEARVEIRRSPPEGRHQRIHRRRPLPPVPPKRDDEKKDGE